MHEIQKNSLYIVFKVLGWIQSLAGIILTLTLIQFVLTSRKVLQGVTKRLFNETYH